MVAARPSVLIHARDTVLVSFEPSSPGGAIKFAMVLKRVDASLITTFSSRSHRQAARFLLVVILVHGDPARFFLLPPSRHLRGRSGPFLTEHSSTTQLERHRTPLGPILLVGMWSGSKLSRAISERNDKARPSSPSKLICVSLDSLRQ